MVKLHVGNLPDDCKEDALRELFVKHGEVERVNVIKNYAFVLMPSEAAANTAVSDVNGTKLFGKVITVQHAKSQGKPTDNTGERRRDNNNSGNRRDSRGGSRWDSNNSNRRTSNSPYNRNQMNNNGRPPPIDPQLQQLGGILGAAPMLLNELTKVQQLTQQQQQQDVNKPDPDIRVRREVVNVRNVPNADKYGFMKGYVIHERYYVLPSHPLLNGLDLSNIPTLGQTNCSRTR